MTARSLVRDLVLDVDLAVPDGPVVRDDEPEVAAWTWWDTDRMVAPVVVVDLTGTTPGCGYSRSSATAASAGSAVRAAAPTSQGAAP